MDAPPIKFKALDVVKAKFICPESRDVLKSPPGRNALIAFVTGFTVVIYALLAANANFHGIDQDQISMASSGEDNNFALAYKESGGFFDDIRAADWRRLKGRIKYTPDCMQNCEPEEPQHWYQNNWEPSFTCLHEKRIGSWGDGGKWVCDPHRITASTSKRGCLVYSVGSSNNFDFEEAVLREISPDCEIHTFDHTIGMTPSNLPKHGKVAFHPWGLVQSDQGASLKSMATIVHELDHDGRTIDILKIDCEGCEWETVRGWFQGGIVIRQVLVEVHAGTQDVMPLPAMEFMSFMKQQGYVIFHKEPNIAWALGTCVEYAFLLLDTKLEIGQEDSTRL